MAENKKSVLLYCDIIHTVENLTDEEAGRLFKHYLKYINDLNPKSDRLTEIIFEPIKQNLKRDLKKWFEKSERNSIIAKEGWQKRKNANACERINSDAKYADKDTVTDTVTDKDKILNNIAETKKVSAYQKCMDAYNTFILKQTGVPAKINALTGKSLKKIILYFEKIVTDKDNLEQSVVNAFEFILLNFDRWEAFHQSQINLNQIESNLINIINSIKNGTAKKKQSISKYI